MCEATSDLTAKLRYEAMREMWRHEDYRGESNWSTQEKELSIKIDEVVAKLFNGNKIDSQMTFVSMDVLVDAKVSRI